eukprot:9109392-Pyramimonas_sp.AAC.1
MLASLEHQAQELLGLVATGSGAYGIISEATGPTAPTGTPAPATPHDVAGIQHPGDAFDRATHPHPVGTALSGGPTEEMARGSWF